MTSGSTRLGSWAAPAGRVEVAASALLLARAFRTRTPCLSDYPPALGPRRTAVLLRVVQAGSVVAQVPDGIGRVSSLSMPLGPRTDRVEVEEGEGVPGRRRMDLSVLRVLRLDERVAGRLRLVGWAAVWGLPEDSIPTLAQQQAEARPLPTLARL